MKIKFSKNIEKFSCKDDCIVFHWSPCGFGFKIFKLNKKLAKRKITALRFSKIHKFGIFSKHEIPMVIEQ